MRKGLLRQFVLFTRIVKKKVYSFSVHNEVHLVIFKFYVETVEVK
jgi:hypothetical protein